MLLWLCFVVCKWWSGVFTTVITLLVICRFHIVHWQALSISYPLIWLGWIQGFYGCAFSIITPYSRLVWMWGHQGWDLWATSDFKGQHSYKGPKTMPPFRLIEFTLSTQYFYVLIVVDGCNLPIIISLCRGLKKNTYTTCINNLNLI
jgi:hypothetical protein